MPSFKQKRRREEVAPVVDRVSKILIAAGIRNQVCGSLRRGCDVVGDADVVVADPIIRTVAELLRTDEVKVVAVSNVSKVKRQVTFLIDEIQFNFYSATPDGWGAMLLFLTGSQLFNILIRSRAKRMGYKLNQYGLWHGDEIIAGRSEEQIFMALDMNYVSPGSRNLRNGERKAQQQMWREAAAAW